MQTNSKVFDDLARLASGALGTAQGVKGEWDNLVRQKIEKMVFDMDLVPREEYDALKAMVVKLVDTVEAQEKKIAALEAAQKPKAAPRKKAATAKKAD